MASLHRLRASMASSGRRLGIGARWIGSGEELVLDRLSHCRAVLSVGPHASRADIKAAFLAAAKRHHPDLATNESSGTSQAFVQLRSCYEELLQNRSENPEPESSHSSSSTSETVKRTRYQPGLGRPRTWAGMEAARRMKKQGPEVPESIVVTAAADKGKKSRRKYSFCGNYRRTRDFNRQPAFVHRSWSFYLFWSEQFKDWKISERLAENGLCMAYVEGAICTAPWKKALASSCESGGISWTVWDANEKCFCKESFVVRPAESIAEAAY